MKRVATCIATVGLAIMVGGCAGPLPAAFGSAASARSATGDLFTSLADRFTNVDRGSRFEIARQKISRAALSPSGVIDDKGVWTSITPDGVHTLDVAAGMDAAGRYRFDPRSDAPSPVRPGDGHHVIRLARAADGSYRWSTGVDHNVGRFRAAMGAAGLASALARLEQPDEAVRAELRTTFPRTGPALGRLLALDSVHTEPGEDGTTRVDLRLGVRPDRLRAAGLPAFAQYVDKYVNGTRWALTLDDGRGTRWMEMRGERGVIRLRLRLRGGDLMTLDGAARPLPDVVELRTTAVTRFGIFDVGVEQLIGDFTTVRTPRERGWTVRWHEPPRWRIPFGMRHLISGALDRPFTDGGMRASVLLRDWPGESIGPTLLVRRFDVSVQESTLVRWFGTLGARAVSDLEGRAEAEQDRFLAEVLRAMRSDVEASYSR